MGKPIKKHPDAQAWERWLCSKEGRDSNDPATLSMPLRMQTYLQNRLWHAFMAGVKHARSSPAPEGQGQAGGGGE